MEQGQLTELIAELRSLRTDHRTIEAKRAATSLPDTAWETMSAFANGDGGYLLLGLYENGGAFDVTGVEDPQQVVSELQAASQQLTPPLRPTIDLLDAEGRTVIVAWVPPVSRDQRPCHRNSTDSSFIRVGDGDQRLTQTEVASMLATRTREDYSRAPAPPDATLDGDVAANFLAQLRVSSARNRSEPDATLLHRSGVTIAGADGEGPRLTLAGLLTMGKTPELMSGAASLAYRRLPSAIDNPNARFAGDHLHGRIGELLDDVMARLSIDLETFQVAGNGHVRDELDVPAVALREIVANALVHRSFAGTLADSEVSIDVSDDAVVITSPGPIYAGADPERLGLDPGNGVRNNALILITQRQLTPAGNRIVEHQSSGVAAADRACLDAATMPALFSDGATSFRVTLVRHSIDPEPARKILDAAGITRLGAHRTLSVLLRLDELRAQLGTSSLDGVVFDAHLAARALKVEPVDAAAELRALEDAGVITRTRTRSHPAWMLNAQRVQALTVAGPAQTAHAAAAIDPHSTTAEPSPPRRPQPANRGGDRLPELLAALDQAGRALKSTEIGEALALTSPSSRNRWIRRAVDANLVEPTTDSEFDPARAYKLTSAGRRQLARTRR